jgi:hypothetical protein
MSPEAIAALINVLSDFVKIVLPAAVATAGTAGVALYAAHVQLKAKRLEFTSGNEFKARESLFAYYRAEGVFTCGAGGTLSCKSHGACHGHLVTLSAAYTLASQ